MLLPAGARCAILTWFDTRGRTFPFRGVSDPYAILVSETMAQQTQIARASAKCTSFLARFPTVDALARAAPAEVLREWRGLGYNRRALNLHRAARVIVSEHGSRVPNDLAALERLPGVGTYTARAVAALAFGRAVGPVDTNVRRVLGRIVGGAESPSDRDLQEIADAAAASGRPADWTHALMDLGATICRPTRPQCAGCPARTWCQFAATGTAVSRTGPRISPATRRPSFHTTARWLRGRLLDRLRDAPGEEWVQLVGPVGVHDAYAIGTALRDMAAEGLVERHPTDPLLARLPPA